MLRKDRAGERLVALFVLGALLLVPPMMIVFNNSVRVLGIPVLYLYLFGIWAGLIALTAFVCERIEPASPATPSPREAAVSGGGAESAQGGADA